MSEPTPALACRGLVSGYGSIEVLHGLDLIAPARSVTTILGPNGAGKTTALLALAGLLPHFGGEVLVHGEKMPSGRPVAVNASGVVLVPDDRALFNDLTVEEHLILAARKGSVDPRSLLDVFPALEPRWEVPASVLSGGEQQMLAVAGGMAQNPRVLLIDEMSMGLAPIIVEALLPVVRAIAYEHDALVVLVEQHVNLALEVADQALVLVRGKVILSGPAEELARDGTALEAAYLGADQGAPD